ncbi:trimeric intracellular cation channel family protein [Mesobaculum littorinae]|uniref:Trimeric intracellular cation channel family protein n=1 Tax=Mesobaculum littorinae TaxID=2486419 RepID=A0A438AJV6_9RHOB|nr:trimeric intracellular cation channel family protein [Mesobaculum littorinae]RVV98939.1 trimeric intracellular cation channel family protein [Mesobaculum littorinae]
MDILPLGVWLDLLGTYVFGISGALLAVRRGLDIFGIAVLSVAAGLAGGMIRDMLLGATPPTALAEPRYLLTALAAAGTAFFGHRLVERLSKPVMMLDALGLGFFAVSGCRKALALELDPLPAILLGVLTAVGGGAVRDLLVAEPPRVLREEIYALAAMIGAAIVVVGAQAGLSDSAVAGTAVAAVFAIRVISVRFGWRAPRARGT